MAAFRATLEETSAADLLLHVIDASDAERREHIHQVEQVLREMGAEGIPRIEVYNKIDQLADRAPHRYNEGANPQVWLSAQRGEGLDQLTQAMVDFFRKSMIRRWLRLPAAAGKLRAQLFELGVVCNEVVGDNGDWVIEVEMEAPRLADLCHNSGYPLEESFAAGA